MLSKKNRLPLRSELQRIKKEGEIFHFSFFSLLIAKNGDGLNRFGFIVSKKIHKKAVIRNRIKRLLREATQSQLAKMKPGFDVVFLIKRKILWQDFPVVSQAVEQALKEGGLL